MFTQNVKQLCGLSVWHKLASPLSMSLWKRRRPCQPARELGRSSFARESQIYWVNEHKGRVRPLTLCIGAIGVAYLHLDFT